MGMVIAFIVGAVVGMTVICIVATWDDEDDWK